MKQFTALAIQSWILYAMSISLVVSRLIFRRITLGHLKRFQADDWLMVSVLLPYTASIVLANLVGDKQSAAERRFRFVLEEMQIVTIWLVKVCLLVLYLRIFPIGSSTYKRRLLQCVFGFCCASFFIVQVSLMLWCQPTEAHWNLSTRNSQCTSYQSHTAITLSFDIPNTILVMILPVPFIPTPRRLLLAILLLLSTLVLITGIAARASILAYPSQSLYLYYYTTESSLSILFANLPFLTSLVTPSRIRHLSSQIAWPRSRRGSWAYNDAEIPMPSRHPRLNSVATTLASPIDLEKAEDWNQEGRRNGDGSSGNTRRDGDGGRSRDSAASNPSSVRESDLAVPSPSAMRPETRDSQVPKTRLSGGLAEMGELSLQDTTQGWPIYWR